MTTALLTPADLFVRDSVMRQLAWDSDLDASGVGVTSREGVVTLTGFIDTYAGKLAAERAAKRVRGVRAVANDIQVRLRLDRTDEDIAIDAARALNLRVNMPETVQAVVHQGHLTLTGTVPTLFLRAVAEKAVHHLKGVVAVVNRLEVRPLTTSHDVKRQIVRALHRGADVNARQIQVEVSGDTVVLTGQVDSWAERESAERAAMHGPGITRVNNHIAVVPPPLDGDDLDRGE